jgi:hypothetical protein
VRGWTRRLRISAALLTTAAVLAACGAEPVAPQRTNSPSLRYPDETSPMFTDSSPELLAGNPGGPSVSASPPTIDFGVFDIDPTRFSTDYGAWANVVRGPDGRYYFGFGDHAANDHAGHDGAILGDYDPGTRKHEILLYSKDLFGPSGEGKFHGRPDINPDTGDMYLIGFYTGHVAHYNIYSRQAADLGAPVPGVGWPEHVWDWKRDRLYGVGGGNGDVLVYDTATHSVIHSGSPIDSVTGAPFRWNDRARLLDQQTGDLYGTDQSNHLTRYDPTTNRFTVMASSLPSPLRAWTNVKEADGSFWIFDTQGDVYRFYPEQDLVVASGRNWGTAGWYVTSIERSPDGHYLYYSLSADRSSPTSQGQPIIQYDTRTNRQKVIAFLSPYYAHARGYQTSKIYGVALSSDGSSLFAISNGRLSDGTRLPAMFDIHIPTSER